jgi:FRG domain
MGEPHLTVVKIKTFKQFVSEVESLRVSGPGRLWYRGCGGASYQLRPTLYRHKIKCSIADCIDNEKALFRRFQQRSIPFRTRTLETEWDMLFFMQHYGVPTRLLDWTENPFFALFFAATAAASHQNDAGLCVFERDACIWILMPEVWNRAAVRLANYEGAILTPDDALLASYRPGVATDVMADLPVAIYGAHNSQRIVAQRGVFVVFGKDVRSMQTIHRIKRFPRRALRKLIIPKSRIRALLEAVTRHGITDSVVFPELEGLARELKREYGFVI